MDNGEKKFWARVGLDATVVLAAATGLLYVFGTYYRIGYLQQWGVEYSLLSSDVYENLVAGFAVLHVGSMFLLGIAILSAIVLSGYNSIAIEISKNEEIKNGIDCLRRKQRRRNEAEHEDVHPKALIAFERIMIKLLRISFILFVASYSFYKAMQCSLEIGKTKAVEEYKQYSQSNTEGDQESLFSKLKIYCIDGIEKTVLLLGTDRNSYALYFPKRKAQDEGVEIVAASRITCIKATRNVAP